MLALASANTLRDEWLDTDVLESARGDEDVEETETEAEEGCAESLGRRPPLSLMLVPTLAAIPLPFPCTFPTSSCTVPEPRLTLLVETSDQHAQGTDETDKGTSIRKYLKHCCILFIGSF